MTKYKTYDEYLLKTSHEYKIRLTAMEIGFLHSLLLEYIKDEENKDKGVDIATFIDNKLNETIDKIRSK